MDLRCNAREEPLFLEINPLPGLKPDYGDYPILAKNSGVHVRHAHSSRPEIGRGALEMSVRRRVTILYDAQASGAPDEADNRVQVDEIRAGLKRLGYSVRELAVGPGLAALENEDAKSLGVCFNLVEGLGGAHFLYTAVAHSSNGGAFRHRRLG